MDETGEMIARIRLALAVSENLEVRRRVSKQREISNALRAARGCRLRSNLGVSSGAPYRI